MAGRAGEDAVQAPVPLDLDDPAVRWRRDGPTLQVERRPTVRSVAPWALFAAALLAAAAMTLRQGDAGLAALFVATAALMGAYAAVRLVHRMAVSVGATGLSWEQRAPRAFAGAWPRGRIGGVRLAEGEKPISWEDRQLFVVEVQVDGRWLDVARGHRRARAVELAEATAAALGMALQRSQAEP